MINVVYLVLVIVSSSSSIAVEKIPQANMAQCQVNAKNYKDEYVRKSYCIVGVK